MQEEIEMPATQVSTDPPPAIPSTSGEHPPAVPSTSSAKISGGRVATTTSPTNKRKLQDSSPQKTKRMVS